MGFLNFLNLRTKLIAAMLAAAALTGVTQAWLGNQNVRSGFEERLDGRLKALAAMTNGQLELFFANAKGTVNGLGSDLMVADALEAFTNAKSSIDQKQLTPEMEKSLSRYYSENYLPRLSKVSEGKPVLEAFVPENVQARYLQYQYISANPSSTGKKDELDEASDGSAYSKVHKKYHPPLRAIRDGFGFYDLFLISPDGQVLYSVSKETDYMSNLVFGPYNDSGLARAFRAAREKRNTRAVVIEDFSFYLPSYGAPAAFIAAPVFIGSEFRGVIVAQLSADLLNTVVNKNKGWAKIGLGATGDIFLVGSDGLYRTTSRPFETDRPAFLAQSEKWGTEKKYIQQMQEFGTPIKLQSTVIAKGVRGGQLVDSIIQQNALGVTVRRFAAPLSVSGLDWVTIAEVPIDEATSQISAFQRLMMIALALSTAITTIGAMLVSGYLVRPVRRLIENIRRVTGGEHDRVIKLKQQDEFGELSSAAQDMADGFKTKLTAMETDRASTEDLFGKFLPEGVARTVTARKNEAGGDTLASFTSGIPSATYVLSRIVGLGAVLAKQPPEQAARMIDGLVELMDMAAENHGLEKVRFAGGDYLAVCGLSTSHFDHRQRSVAFAVNLRKLISQFSSDNGAKLGVRISIASGEANSSLVGRKKLDFELWGAPLMACENLSLVATDGEICVTEEIAEAVKQSHTFTRNARLKSLGLLLSSGEAVSPTSKTRVTQKRKR